MWKCIAGEEAGREKLAVVYIQVVRKVGVREVGEMWGERGGSERGGGERCGVREVEVRVAGG